MISGILSLLFGRVVDYFVSDHGMRCNTLVNVAKKEVNASDKTETLCLPEKVNRMQ